MALSSTQKLQFLRLPFADASVTSDDKHALLGLVVVATSAPTLTAAQRRQILRLAVIDASVTTSDKFAFLGLMESVDAGALYELFETAWLVDPTWTALEFPQTNAGNVFAEIGGFNLAWVGTNVDPIILPAEEGTSIVNLDAVFVKSNYEICDRTGFRQYPHDLQVEYYGHAVRARSFDIRHPQEINKPRGTDKQTGSKSPEPEDVFVGTINPEDL